ncbi:DUF29 domain-containing protein [Aphanizomenon flos-aquae NRERC-008]|jgi:hypothetical protein|uniref:DUF29 domain-containing protein n=1 Tax=Aphanizomenon flos-aquae FACHB-1249 TaxID=2692889 RepID=A0ABR8IPL1_APHFL|nr:MULTISPECIES: DUF29 domain-containing protein [Aphanizomenon]MCE2906122.1 DUF29 domain-containing protein [Anabaena sp. CoA2_C59]MDJ0504053.1 DUF29 domain-containing protein [Nostocales cyanobacterium LE14-WE12]MBD2389807.1 DUF29 domain-containing protein [Aphanizomenon flos-aquae FACHB-1171]MBD2557559.1 DUF29 domain-containing protein [Aphanizomenon flos-aquae FACHB-1290]MBD2631345.1 DUF29 domain-containing protein [Aphanizomenon sp. FACHB-1399]
MTLAWNELVFQSPYLAVVKAKQLLQEGKMTEVDQILENLVESMGRSEKRAVSSQLTRLMLHIIKWKCQPEKRSPSWVISIRSARREITDSQEEMPSLNQEFLESIWDKCFASAKQDARDEMGKKPEIIALSWDEVFEEIYTLWEDENI